MAKWDIEDGSDFYVLQKRIAQAIRDNCMGEGLSVPDFIAKSVLIAFLEAKESLDG